MIVSYSYCNYYVADVNRLEIVQRPQISKSCGFSISLKESSSGNGTLNIMLFFY